MNNYNAHQNQLNKTTLYLQKKFPEARFFSRHVGKFYSSRIFSSIYEIHTMNDLKTWLVSIKNKFLISINKPGMPDQYAIFPVNIYGKIIPVHIEIETKTGNSRLSESQKKWKAVYERMGVKYVISRNHIDAERQIKEYLETLK